MGIDIRFKGGLGSRSLPFGIEPRTVLAQRLSTSARAAVLRLDVVALRAFGVVVMHVLLDRVPWCYLGHDLPFCRRDASVKNRRCDLLVGLRGCIGGCRIVGT